MEQDGSKYEVKVTHPKTPTLNAHYDENQEQEIGVCKFIKFWDTDSIPKMDGKILMGYQPFHTSLVFTHLNRPGWYKVYGTCTLINFPVIFFYFTTNRVLLYLNPNSLTVFQEFSTKA